MKEQRHLALEILYQERKKNKFLFVGLSVSLITNIVLVVKILGQL